MAIDNFTDISMSGFDEDAITIICPRVLAADSARSQVINEGQITVTTTENIALSVRGEGASALNRGEIVITASPGSAGIDGNAIRGLCEVPHIASATPVRASAQG